MRSVGLALALVLLGSQARGQGYKSAKDIPFEDIERVSWEHAYRAVETPGAREYLEELLKSGAAEHVTAARALLYIMDGKSHREYLTAKFQELPEKLKKIEAQIKAAGKDGAARDGLGYAVLTAEFRPREGGLAAAALYHHGDVAAFEFMLRSLGRCPKRDEGSLHQQEVRLLAEAVSLFGWQRVPQDDALKYLASDDAELRTGALVFLLGDPEATGPTAPAFYDPAKSAKANQKAIAEITAHFQKMRSGLAEEQQERLRKIKQEAQAQEKKAKAQTDLDALYTAYQAAAGEEKKRLALELDRLERVDYTKDFGHPYPGKPLDHALARRSLGIDLFVKKMLLNMTAYNLLPLAERDQAENKRKCGESQHASLRAKLGMPDEAKTVAEGWAFLAHVDAVLDGKEQELLHEKLAWNYCGVSYKYNHLSQARTLEEYEKWERWFGWENEDRFAQYPEEMALLIKRWAVYMARNYKIEDYLRSHVMVDIYRERLRLEFERAQRAKGITEIYEYGNLFAMVSANKRLLPAELAEIEKVARLHLEETGDFIAGKRPDSVAFGMPPSKDTKPPKNPAERYAVAVRACRAYVLWQAMIATKSFEDYVYWEELNRYRNTPPWEGRDLAKQKYPALVTEFAATYQRLLGNHPDLKPPAKK